jgi:hypothetical protein
MMRWIASTLFDLLSIPANSVSLQSSELSLRFAVMASLHRGTPIDDQILSRIFDRHVGDPNVNAIKTRLQEACGEIKTGTIQLLVEHLACEADSWRPVATE